MRVEEIKVYEFDELSDEAKERAIQGLYDINIDHDWWEQVYADAANVGIKITGFDVDRGSYCEGEFVKYAIDIAKKIIDEHGIQCDTYKTAAGYLPKLMEEWEGDYDGEPEAEEFKKSVLEDYRIMLSKEYDYLISEEAIVETIQANGYEFTENGKLY